MAANPNAVLLTNYINAEIATINAQIKSQTDYIAQINAGLQSNQANLTALTTSLQNLQQTLTAVSSVTATLPA